MLVTVISLLMPQKISAQSTVYFFMRKICNTELDVFQNSKPIFDMVGPVTKTQQVKSAMVLPLNTQAACKRKAVFAATGKTIFSIDATYTNPVNAKTAKYAAEIQLNLIDGATFHTHLSLLHHNHPMLQTFCLLAFSLLLCLKEVPFSNH